PIPQELFFLVGWAGEPVPSIEEKDFCKRSYVPESRVVPLVGQSSSLTDNKEHRNHWSVN
ncbi:hypothetical protein QUA50_10390, partial [Microcoleus sp. M2_D5]|uniref:hypothetical protein n=1 Tax=Microcoleus sp. M2_D5 TaxID=3055376 RepID=UPI003B03EF2F